MDGQDGYAKQKSMNPLILKALSTLAGQKLLITIDGVAGCGKTTLASECEEILQGRGFSVTTIHMDDLYDGWNNALTQRLSQALVEIVDGFKTGEFAFSSYDWFANIFNERRTFASPDILILEGVGSGQKVIRDDVTLSIWIDMDPQIARERVVTRDGERVRPYMDQWLINQQTHFQAEGTQGAADYCIDGAP